MRVLNIVLMLICVVLANPQNTSAQSIDARYTKWWGNGEQVTDVDGPGIGVEFRGFVLQADRLAGSTERMDVPCGGFIFDPRCFRQATKLDFEMTRVALGYRIANGPGNWRLDIMPAVGISHVSSEKQGLQTDVSIDGQGHSFELSLAFTALHRIGQSRFFIGASAFGGLYLPTALTRCADCYEPFQDGFSMAGLSLVAHYAFGR